MQFKHKTKRMIPAFFGNLAPIAPLSAQQICPSMPRQAKAGLLSILTASKLGILRGKEVFDNGFEGPWCI